MATEKLDTHRHAENAPNRLGIPGGGFNPKLPDGSHEAARAAARAAAPQILANARNLDAPNSLPGARRRGR